MANGKIVKYKRVYKITVEGQTDTKHPEDEPFGLYTVRTVLTALVDSMDMQYKNRNVTIEELPNDQD